MLTAPLRKIVVTVAKKRANLMFCVKNTNKLIYSGVLLGHVASKGSRDLSVQLDLNI